MGLYRGLRLPPPLGNALYTLRKIRDHPLMKSRRIDAYTRWLRWQIASRLVPGPIIVDYVNGTRLCLRAGMHGATMNVYVGLDEFRAMSFLLHLLRPEDTFADVGANVGEFTILASGAAHARTIAFEPAPDSYADLVMNVKINNLEGCVECRRIALSNRRGEVCFTTGLDTLNHVVQAPESDASETTRVETSTLDDELRASRPVLIKIDAEGYEDHILDGGEDTLSSRTLSALIVEINENCHRYGRAESQVFERILDYGFIAVGYDAVERRLTRCESWQSERGTEASTLFVRDLDAATERLRTAPKFRTVAYEI